jgi:hypothetical protein
MGEHDFPAVAFPKFRRGEVLSMSVQFVREFPKEM